MSSDDEQLSAAELIHDLRNMLAVVQVTGDSLLRRLAPDSDAWRDARDLADAAARCRDLAQRLATIAAAPAGSSLDVNGVLGAMRGIVERIAGPAVEVRFDLSPDPCLVSGERLALERVIINLVINAAEAMEEGGRLTLATRRAGDRVCITVADTGTGLEPAAVERIWEPGFSTRAPDGRGVGLSSVRRAVTRWAGTVTVRSSPGHGTTFVIHLPAE